MRKNYQTADVITYELLKGYAKSHRQKPTEAEATLWGILKDDALGVRFRRQYIICDFIADFVCLPAKLIIETDGGYHSLPEQIVSDEQRTEILRNHGYKVIRFTNEEILFDTEKAITRIKENLNKI